jgi:hypothetical protein
MNPARDDIFPGPLYIARVWFFSFAIFNIEWGEVLVVYENMGSEEEAPPISHCVQSGHPMPAAPSARRLASLGSLS